MRAFDEPTAVRNYLALMREVVVRLDVIAAACNGQLNLTPPYAHEYCYLQYRRICELLALGCVQLHGDLPEATSSAITREWNAEKVLSRLHKHHPYAFPQSVTVTKTSDGVRVEANSKPGALTFAEFKTLYSTCGRVLHRGTIRTVELERPLEKADYDRLIDWSRKIVDLLNQHLISRPTAVGFYLVTLKSEDAAGGPACSVFSGFEDGGVRVANYFATAD